MKKILDFIEFVMLIIEFILLVLLIILAYPFYRRDISEIIKSLKDEFRNQY